MPSATVQIEDVTAKGDWFNIQTDSLGRLSTKKRDLATAARDLKGLTALVDYTEKVNGEWTNRYLDKIVAASMNGGSGATSKDTMIHRQTAGKIAAWLAPHLPEEERTPAGLVQLAEFWVDYFENGPSEHLQLEVPFTADDDIPF